MGRDRAGLHRGFLIGKTVLKRRDESFVFIDFDIVLQLGEMWVVVADLHFFLIPVGLHQA